MDNVDEGGRSPAIGTHFVCVNRSCALRKFSLFKTKKCHEQRDFDPKKVDRKKEYPHPVNGRINPIPRHLYTLKCIYCGYSWSLSRYSVCQEKSPLLFSTQLHPPQTLHYYGAHIDQTYTLAFVHDFLNPF
jgi:hypothetical protein